MRKKRDIRAAYRKAGFAERKRKGDHTVFSHPLVRKPYAADGKDGTSTMRRTCAKRSRSWKRSRGGGNSHEHDHSHHT